MNGFANSIKNIAVNNIKMTLNNNERFNGKTTE
jgi:hypothetical protein